jgi:hypothetical protein
MHAPKVTHEIDADEWIDWPPDAEAPGYDFTVWNGLLFVGCTYRGRIIFAPASIIHGGIADGRFVYTKDPRKRVKIEPPDLTLIGRESMPRNRNVLWAPRHQQPIPIFDRGRAGRDGVSLVAHWQFQRVGNATPTVAHEIDADLSRAQLDRLARCPWNAYAKHIVWNWKKHWEIDRARFHEENARRYRRRLDHSAKSYDDLLRWNGKAKCKFDETYAQASGREWDERLFGREPSGQPHDEGSDGYLDKHREHWRPLPFRSLGLQPQCLPVNLAECWRKWVMIAWWLLWHQETIWPQRPRPKPHYWYAIPTAPLELVSEDATERNKNVKGQSRKRVTFLGREEIPALVLAAKTDIAARNKLLDRCRPAIEGIARPYASAANPIEDLINQAIIGTESDNGNVTNGLVYAIKMHDSSRGAFLSFIRLPCRNAILKYIEQQPQHTSLNLNAPINPDDEDGDTYQDMIIDEGSDYGEEYEAA